jgi:transcriptional regulator with XRE-family HTH domain
MTYCLQKARGETWGLTTLPTAHTTLRRSNLNSITSAVMGAPPTACYAPGMIAMPQAQTRTQPVGDLLREWRQRRRKSQLELSLDADISTKHLSFLETGRSQPSRDMVLLLAEQLEIPLRDRNVLLVSAGYAPVFAERPLHDPALQAARKAVDLVLAGHEPYPALAVDRHWTLIAANAAVNRLLAGTDAAMLEPPVNVLRLSLHPKGLAPRIVNLGEWRAHLLARLRRQVEVSGDPMLTELLAELAAYPAPDAGRQRAPLREPEFASVVVPLQFATTHGVLSFFSTTTVFGTPLDITLSELALESFFPADAATAEALRRQAESTSSAVAAR